jgi:hypothetical protein
MERIEYRNVVDKSDYLPGPWNDEPDKVQWQDEATGLPCLIVRGPFGALCGYVGVSRGHPLHCVDNEGVASLKVHGGITFAGGCDSPTQRGYQEMLSDVPAHLKEAKSNPHGDSAKWVKEWLPALTSFASYLEHHEGKAICHRVEPGQPDDVWWLGFDCAHAGDTIPATAFVPTPTGLTIFKAEMCHDVASDWENSYKDIQYVTAECARLAKQLAAIEPTNGA